MIRRASSTARASRRASMRFTPRARPEACMAMNKQTFPWSRDMNHQRWILALAASLGLAGAAHAQSSLRIGLAEDPDVLDPTLARTFVGRIVFAALCDKLIDIDEKLAMQ